MNKRVHNVLRKQAGVWSDALLGLPGMIVDPIDRMGLPLVGNVRISTAVGGLSGTHRPKKKQVRDLLSIQNSRAKALIPFVSPYRIAKRRSIMQQLLRDEDDDTAQARQAYDWISRLNPLNWAASPFAALAAAVTDKRTLAEHKAKTVDEPHYGWKSFLIPGYNTYTRLKTQGVSDRITTGISERDMQGLDDETKQAIRDALAEHKKGKEKDKDTDKDKDKD